MSGLTIPSGHSVDTYRGVQSKGTAGERARGVIKDVNAFNTAVINPNTRGSLPQQG